MVIVTRVREPYMQLVGTMQTNQFLRLEDDEPHMHDVARLELELITQKKQ